jgi:type VI secretion system secreted protein Hcp
MAFDAFLNIDGVPGESTDDKHKGWIEILSFSHGETQPSSATASSAGGGTTERVSFDDLMIMKHIDKASAKLHELCASGKHIATVTLQLCRAGGDKQQYMEVKMDQVVISSVRASGASGMGGSNSITTRKAGGDPTAASDGFPVEQVSFNFGKVKWTYTQQKRADGSGGGNTTGGWDLTSNKVAS